MTKRRNANLRLRLAQGLVIRARRVAKEGIHEVLSLIFDGDGGQVITCVAVRVTISISEAVFV